MTKITCTLGTMRQAAVQLRDYKKKMLSKVNTLVRKLANEGMVVAKVAYQLAPYDGDKDVTVKVTKTEKGCKITASGFSVLFLEFGSGVTSGYGHPYNSNYNMGPSTWSLGPDGKGHWDNPNGWWFTSKEGESVHTMGNPPAKGMVQAQQKILYSVNRIAREVFGK